MGLNFWRKAESINEILDLIASVETGLHWVSLIRAAHASSRISIEALPEEVARRLSEARDPGAPAGACFVGDEAGGGTIYLDLSSELGVLAPFLLHEIVHSLDEGLVRAASLQRQARDELILESECRAFEIQHRFTQELSEADPAYREFLRKAYPRARILHERMDRDEISALYGLKAA